MRLVNLHLDEILQILYFYNISLQRVLNNNIIIIYPYLVYGFTILKYLSHIFYANVKRHLKTINYLSACTSTVIFERR